MALVILKEYIIFLFVEVIISLAVLILMILAVAYLTLMERKIIASIQRRKGPNVVGLFGVLQPIADAAKLIGKESIYPFYANKGIYFIGPMITLFLSLSLLVILPLTWATPLVDINIALLYATGVGSLGLYGIIFSGWASNSRYGFLGAVRTTAQMVSYEVSLGMFLVVILAITNSLSLVNIEDVQNDMYMGVGMFVVFVLYFICVLAETNRAPFDLPEAEAELVAGYFVEHSSMGFASFFLGEYHSMILISGVLSIIFLGGRVDSFLFYIFKILFVLFCFIWIRAAFPRYRYDQLMRLGWKVILPLSFGCVLLYGGFRYITEYMVFVMDLGLFSHLIEL
jgi:NADH-quinone oxidoreductase subunit H